jgi:hypothetical protein
MWILNWALLPSAIPGKWTSFLVQVFEATLVYLIYREIQDANTGSGLPVFIRPAGQ